jgi:hypothetical protein
MTPITRVLLDIIIRSNSRLAPNLPHHPAAAQGQAVVLD